MQRRTSEVGIHLALGSTRPAVLWLVIRETLLLAGFGAVMGLAFADRLRRWIDRRFFREAYEADKIWLISRRECGRWWRPDRCLRRWRAAWREALHVPRMVILLGGNGVFRPAYAVVYGASPNGTFTEQRVPIQS
jgi:hypothetical protein